MCEDVMPDNLQKTESNAAFTDELRALLPCPCCGDDAAFCVVDSDGLIDGNAGGWYVECNNPMCGITTPLVFPCGDDPRDRLRDVWNTRKSSDKVLTAAKNLVAQKGRHNTEIAYKRLVDALTHNA